MTKRAVGKILQASAQAPAGKARAIDIHHHYASPAWVKALGQKLGHHSMGYSLPPVRVMQLFGHYSPANVVEFMDREDVATAILSSAHVWFGDPEETRFLVRDLSEFAARMVSDYKGRFGLWAPLPFPTVDDTLREIEYVFDTLHADGVGVFTSYQGRWLGDPSFRPIFDELNRRKATVFVHPIDAFADLMPYANTGALEFLTDTMRTIFSLLVTGSATRYGDVRFIFSHAGGAMPSLIERFGVGLPGTHPDVFAAPAAPNSNLYHLRRFYYDAANSCNPAQLQALKTILGGSSQIVFGSDWPFVDTAIRQLQGLQKCGFSAQELAGIHRGNAAERLLPRLNGSI
jgi:predicted TIM-barrel fold metal-dependent hydrolase